MKTARDYGAISARLSPEGDLVSRLRRVADECWEALHASGVSWIGFYSHSGDREMTLTCCRNKPACSPIGLHGACGQAFSSQRTLIVRDVRELGPNYIACDPRDQSEIVIPVFDEAGRCFGVLDVDSFDIGAFDESDERGFKQVLQAAGVRTQP